MRWYVVFDANELLWQVRTRDGWHSYYKTQAIALRMAAALNVRDGL